MLYLKQSTASQAVLIGPFIDDTDGKTAETGLTIANTDIRLSKNGGNMAAKNSGGGTHDEAGWYAITFDATDTATVGRLQVSVDVAGALPVWAEFQVVEEDTYTWLFASGAAPDTQVAAIKTVVDTIPTTAMRGTDGANTTTPPTVGAIADAVQDEPLADHQTQGTAGAAITMTAYLGPHGPGVYLDDGAANTGTTLGDDGTVENPVSTIAAATTIASNLGVQTFYLINDTVITLAQTYEGYTFVGLGVSNKITLGSSDVDNSEFHNLILTGTQGGTGQMHAIGCSLTALVSAEIIAENCWWSGDVALRAGDNHMFAGCRSSMPGDVTPTLTFPGSGVTKVSIRGHSGGIELVDGIAADVITTEFIAGQLIIAASCNDMTVRPRGVLKFTNNGTGINIELEAAINLTNVQDTVWAKAMTELAAVPGVTGTVLAALEWLFELSRNKGTQTSTTKTLRNDADSADIATSAISSDGTTFTREKWS